jgi:regulator of RNase E activity RraA
MSVADSVLAELARYDTPTICNAIELFDVLPRNRGFTDGRIKANFPDFPPVVGYAATAAFRSDAPPGSGDAYGSMEKQIEQFATLPGPAFVVIQDLDDPPAGAVFGEVMCSVYKAFGSVGLLTNGAGRDILQVQAIGYPIFTGSTICSHAYCHLLHLGLPVRIGGLSIVTGDLLHADANGVAAIPPAILDELPQVAEEFASAERPMLDYLHSAGEKSHARFTELRREFVEAIKRLGQRVSRKNAS